MARPGGWPYGSAQGFTVNLAQVFAIVAVIATALYVLGHRFGTRSREAQKSLAWLVGAVVAIWIGLMVLAMGWFFVSHLMYDEPGISFPEGDAIAYIALRDGPYAEELDAEVLWTVVHPDIRAQTSRSEFFDCFFAQADRPFPPYPASAIDELESSLGGVAFYRGELPSDNVLVKDGNTYSATERRNDRRIAVVEVRVERPQDTSVVTVLLSEGATDGDGPPSYVVGTVPADPCLVGAETVRDRLQATATITIGNFGSELPELNEYQVLAVVWDGYPDEANLIGGASWSIDEGGNGAGVVHPLDEGDVAAAGDDEEDLQPDDPDFSDEPPQPGEWVSQAFLSARAAQLEPGTYTIEVWANPIELTPSDTPGVPARDAERNCVIDVDVTAGTRLDILIEDIPTGGECPHEIESRFGF